MNNQYRLKIKFGDIEIEVEGTDKEYVNHNFEKLSKEYIESIGRNATNNIMKTTEGSKASAEKEISKSMSSAEFVRIIKPKSGTDYAVTLGYYLEKIVGKEEFTGADIKNKFIEVKFKHSNPSDTISKAKTTGRIMDGHEKNSYILTQTGEQWVEDRLE